MTRSLRSGLRRGRGFSAGDPEGFHSGAGGYRTDVADTPLPSNFDKDGLTGVYSAALSFIVPRILTPVPVPQLTLWGLQGLTTLEPALHVVAADDRMRLMCRNEVVLDVPAPDSDTPFAWADTAVALTAGSFAASEAVRQAGTKGIVQGFFDQLFSRVDPYSRYISPVEADEDRAKRAGRAGVGLTVEQHGGLIGIRSVMRDSPAAVAGLRPGDIVAAIDGRRTREQDPVTIATLLSGREGSAVTLAWRGRDGRTHDVHLVRAVVPPETVFAQRVADFLTLRITSFGTGTASHVASSVQDALAERHPIDGIILDLRDNHGGLLREAVTVADTFLPAGLVATTVGRHPNSMNVWRSTEGELAENVPVIILVDSRTASAAEILAAALADRGRAVVVGSVTMGKGTVQTIDPLPDGGELFVTWSQIIAPLGWPIQGLGVLPQVCTGLGQEALNRQLASLSAGFQPMADPIRRARATRLPASDMPEIRASCPATEARPADLEAARLLISNPAAYAAALLPPMIDR